MKYSVIIPVYNRPDEVNELLESLTLQTCKDFEVVVVEDGSSIPCQEVVEKYSDRLDIHYYNKPNSGPGQTRNYGAERSHGEYLIILDSDCILPINYSMTSFFTTGGIRGGKKKMDKFYPRSFNMGVRRSVYQTLRGFSKMRFGEDIDFSIRIFKAGYRCRLFPSAWVYHKRRTDLKKFFKQVHNSGIARINLYKKYPESLKLVHLLPALFTLGTVLLLICAIFCPYALLPLLAYALLVCIDSTIQNGNIRIGLYSIAAAYIQLIGYGTGFWRAWWNRCIYQKGEFEAFKKNFYK